LGVELTGVFEVKAMLKKVLCSIVLTVVTPLAVGAVENKYQKVQPVPLSEVKINDVFWSHRLEVNRLVTIPFVLSKCEETGIIDNFDKASGAMKGKFKGLSFSDSHVYKWIRGASLSLFFHYDPKLDKYLDGLIAGIAAAQDKDGYINTAKLVYPRKKKIQYSDDKMSNLRSGMELYVFGHLYLASVAHYQCTNKRTLLNIAIKNADYLVRMFGPDKRRDVPGHPIIGIGLVRLYYATGNENYYKLAKFFIDERGYAHGRKLGRSFRQDHIPVIEQSEAVGQAPRAVNLYTGVTAVAAITHNTDYIKAMDRLWENVVYKKMYVTGGIGSLHKNEGFGENYALPNKTAYSETCAAISFSMWNWQMFLLHRNAKYIDVLERTVYNNFPAGVSLAGDRFFYANPLESDGKYEFNQGYTAKLPRKYTEASATRKEWFYCPCCPTNAICFVPSVANFIYSTVGDETVYINLFIGSNTTLSLNKNNIKIAQETRYPWDGRVKITVEPKQPKEFTINVRIPGWARNIPVPGNLYSYLDSNSEKVTLKVNGKSIMFDIIKGYARIKRQWQKGDVIELYLPMPIRRVIANPNVEADRGLVALQRGPVVFCLEEADNGKDVRNIFLPEDAELTARFRPDFLDGVITIKGTGFVKKAKGRTGKAAKFLAIPYYSWSNRGVGQMTVWIPTETK